MMMMKKTNQCYDVGDDVVSIVLYCIVLCCVDDGVCMYCGFVVVLILKKMCCVDDDDVCK